MKQRMKEPYEKGVGAAMLADIPVGESPAGGNCPVATVVIPDHGKGDRPVESSRSIYGWTSGARNGRKAKW